MLSFDRDVAQMLHAGPLRSARNSLLWVAGLVAVGALFAFAASGGRGTVTLVVGLLVAAVYAGLWQWAKQQPLGATAAGLGIFATLLVGSAAANPA
ncbi:MAG TPA: hypothetical protein VIM73_23010, partial [Polyangiaceae bacterium]